MDKFAELREAVEMAELVDAHAHNLVALDSTLSFLHCFSEADGDALSYAPHTLVFKRSLRDIAELYGCESSLCGIEEYRRCSGLQSISSICFKASRFVAILIDDGIEFDKKHEIEWHRNFAPVVGRILRIERLAEKILDEGRPDGATWTLDTFFETFIGKLKSFADKISSLKSIAAYRSGLEINTKVTRNEAQVGLDEVLHAGSPARITNKNFIDYLFMQSLEVALQFDLPMQIHTGFGDKDLDLRLSNPLHLRMLLEDNRFSKSRIVLLHASYPFSKEASYLASVYQQVYLDFGLAVPKLSVHGMISSVKELLELAPIKKVMFSTDGYAFPETSYLGANRARKVVFSVLRDACIDGDLSIPEAIEAVKDIFTENARKFYRINLDVKHVDSKTNISNNFTKMETDALQPDVALVRIIWVDASGQHRCRVVPRKRFHDIVTKNGVGLTVACMAMSSAVDGPADDTNLSGVGEIRLMPDLSTKWRIPWEKQDEMVLADMHLKPGESWEYCPREALRRVSKVLKDEFNLVMNAGFENEFFLLKSILREGKEEWTPFDSAPYCSTSAFDAAAPIFREIVAALQYLNIEVEQIHAEAGKGQFEMALGYTTCTNAADNLVYAREVVRAVARKHGFLATFMPKYALDDIGSGSHVHLSLWENGKNVFMASGGQSVHGMSKVGEEFMAGVLEHLPSILAFTAPVPNSYDRIQPNTWSGAYQCWGKENREAPLRTACPPGAPDGIVSNFEIKSFDGCANPHLGLASVIAAGIDGLRRHLSLPESIDTNPYVLDSELQRLPRSLSESVEALDKDNVLKDLIGEKLLVAIKGIRKAEIAYYSQNKDAYKQLIHRY
ncbi:Protein fluG like [Actinidia chinensis var. chinensis]|uniref:Protein fluG like n=1 Tax=Actinidia chinensis var. chinensis TaxID=1590841 RepID=A0A2R6RS85_ACTCC|nr:Protein fluG like [Actinidia chinensis var. chinensis]